MLAAINQFNQNFIYIRDLGALHATMIALGLPNDLSDLLRGQWVYAVSALDKLNHELVRIGMLEIFNGARPATNKFDGFSISATTVTNMMSGTVPPPAYWFEQEILSKHQILAFQHPDKIADALSLIWSSTHKWQEIASAMGMPETTVRTTLTTIVGRRNQIVHEADIDPVSTTRRAIGAMETTSTIDFLERLGQAIYSLVH